MNVKATDLDAIFNGAGSVINTTQNITNAVAQGITEIKGVMDNSRRSTPMMQPQIQTYQPVTYGYGYSDNNNYQGYPGMGGYNGYSQMHMNVGYPGFTNANYGNMVGMYQNNQGLSVQGPQGGAWY